MALDPQPTHAGTSSAEEYEMIGPGDFGTKLKLTREITIGTPGDLVVRRPDGTLVEIPESVIAAKSSFAIRITSIEASGPTLTTTAADIFVLY